MELKLDGWTCRLRPASAAPVRLLVMLHGWKGDESSMWAVAAHMPEEYTVLTPRAPYPERESGYTWRATNPVPWKPVTLEELREVAGSLMRFLDLWAEENRVPVGPVEAAGFSQGAALAYAIALLYPDRVKRFAALSGFLPEGSREVLASPRIRGMQGFVAHGRQDEVIPVERAREDVSRLQEAGVEITYCESDSGHRAGRQCLRAMEAFFGRVI